jgi:hypothetical protein
MPSKQVVKRAKKDAAEGKAPSTQAGEFVREEIHHVREGKHGARSAKQAIAIGLSKARRAGVKLPPAPSKGKPAARSKSRTRPSKKVPSARRSQATLEVLQDESHRSASHAALSRQARQAAKKRGPVKRRRAAKKAAKTRRRTGA